MGVPPKSRFRKTLRNLLNSQVVLFCAGLASGLIVSLWARHPQAVPVAARSAGQSLSLADNVLVIYSFFEGDEASWGNLEFFVQQGVEADDGAQYVFVLNGLRSLSDPRLPRLPPNARYVLHENECYDWGTYAWVFSTVQDPEEFQYVIIINSSVRGPITMSPALHWTRLFTDRINEHVKLVGPAISCEHFCLMEEGAKGLERKGCRKNAHVQSVAVGMDQVGLKVLKDAGYVLRCHKNRFEAVYYGEIGASLAILNAGYNIDSFLVRYRDVNWRDKSNWECNKALSPLGKRTFDGVSVSALEMVFPKLKGSLLESGIPSHFEALKMSQWLMSPAKERNITVNSFVGGDQMKAEDILVAMHKGKACFDWEYYIHKNPDVATLPKERMWRHFLDRGSIEFREHRWLCSLNEAELLDGNPGVHHN